MSELQRAAQTGNLQELLRLLERGDNAQTRNPKHKNAPIHFAAHAGHSLCVEALLSAGADANSIGNMGDSPLHHAAEKGHTETAQLLIHHGADCNLRSFYGYGELPIQKALEKGHLACAKLLRDSGTDLRNHPDLATQIANYEAELLSDASPNPILQSKRQTNRL